MASNRTISYTSSISVQKLMFAAFSKPKLTVSISQPAILIGKPLEASATSSKLAALTRALDVQACRWSFSPHSSASVNHTAATAPFFSPRWRIHSQIPIHFVHRNLSKCLAQTLYYRCTAFVNATYLYLK